MASKPNGFRRLLQIRLQTLLVVVPVAGALLGGLLLWVSRPAPIAVVGPLTTGDFIDGAPAVLPPPSDDEVLRATAIDFQDGADVVIEKELVDWYADHERNCPLIGPAVLHHAIYRCSLSDGFTTRAVYIDHNHLHMVRDEDRAAD
jgi:hypothetical protein